MTGIGTATYTNADQYQWMWKRAPKYFDVVAYTGNGTAGRTVSHNLGVAPEMMWVKQRPYSSSWTVYHKDIGAANKLILNDASGTASATSAWNSTAPTSSVLTYSLRRTSLMSLHTRATCLLYTSPSPRDRTRSRMPSSA